MDAYLQVSKISANRNLGGKWVVRGWIANTHTSKAIESVTIRFNFDSGSETRTIYKTLNPGGLGKPFKEKISGHNNDRFESWDVVSAD